MLTAAIPTALSTSLPSPQPASDSTSHSVPKYLQEDDLTQERKDLISSLPTESGWVANCLHQYQGFWHTTRQLQGVLTCQKHFHAQDSDTLLVTTPKSGTTWLKAIAFSLINRSKHAINDPHHPLYTNNPHDLVPFIELKLYIENQVPDLSVFASPRLFSTHLPLVSLPKSVNDSGCKIVYLCRNPKDAFVSLWHFTNKLRPKDKGVNSLEKAFDKFCNGVSLYGPFWEHVLGYWKAIVERPKRVFFLKFEEMKEKPAMHLKRLAEFLECPFSKEEELNGTVGRILEMCSFDSLRNLEVNKTGKMFSGEEFKAFFRRGEVGDWKNHLTDEMAERLDGIIECKLHGSGLRL
ncbi:hypothetical protein Patl1_08003 [Pistacia atlantica]|uniref:Uncharacterized protein n=1 Tax=Pistacia atlantica TaxID=434234 RepID=A0ACC1AHE6_9ROSI|nr:hypothetical protein Patl1_08003 [Pistacia atlantica]